MRILFTPLLLLAFIISKGQNQKEKELKTEISEVTVFLTSAQIFESGSVSLTEGKTLLKIKALPRFIDEKSIQVKGEGSFMILSVNHKLNFLDIIKKDARIDSLKLILKALESSSGKDAARLTVLNEKQILLNDNRNFGGSEAGVSIAQLKEALELYESEVSAIEEEKLLIKERMEQRKLRKEGIEMELKELNDEKPSPTSEIDIHVHADASTNGKFRITYLVSNAGWFPKYDVRVKDIRSPLQITYKAEVFQNTGVDWKNVKLRFSNGDPNQSGQIPDLKTWNLSYVYATSPIAGRMPGLAVTTGLSTVNGKVFDGNGDPIPGANVILKGTTIGTTTDINGNYMLTLPAGPSTLIISFIGYNTHEIAVTQPQIDVTLREDVQSLEEVVVTGYDAGYARGSSNIRLRGLRSTENEKPRAIPTSILENQTTVEIEVETPYSIKANGEKLMVDLKNFDVEALYRYYAIPKLERDAFLVARIINWDKYNLLEGEANLYFEDAYVGRSILDAKSLKDTLDISLGRDRNIVIGREKVEQFCKRKALGSNVVETRAFQIIARNKKSLPIDIIIFDQIPVSVTADIEVDILEQARGILEERSGKVKWTLQILPQQQKDLMLHYEVKYPKREYVQLE